MFNNSLKKEALRIHKETLDRYNKSYKEMGEVCEQLYEVREQSIEIIRFIQRVINSISNTPKDFSINLGKIDKELVDFKKTEEYAKEAYDTSLKVGTNIAGGAAMGMSVATITPTALMSVATTFGTASTGTAISALSGAAAEKAAVAWIGRTFAGIAVKGGAGMGAGQAFLALAGPVGWGCTAATTSISLISLTKKNKKLADEVVEKAKDIAIARETLDETTAKVEALKVKTDLLFNDITKQKDKIESFMNKNYILLTDEDRLFLGSLVNNTLSLSVLLNETIE